MVSERQYIDQRPPTRIIFIQRPGLPQQYEQPASRNSPRQSVDQYRPTNSYPPPRRFLNRWIDRVPPYTDHHPVDLSRNRQIDAAPTYGDYHSADLKNRGMNRKVGTKTRTNNQPYLDADALADIAEAAANRIKRTRRQGGGEIPMTASNYPGLDADAQADIAEAAARRRRQGKTNSLSADAQADLADAAADRRRTMRESKPTSLSSNKKQRSGLSSAGTSAENHQQSTSTSADKIQMDPSVRNSMDPAVRNSIQNLAHTLGAETISVSRTVENEPPIASAKPPQMDALYNEFLAFMSKRLKQQSKKDNMWNESSISKQPTEPRPVEKGQVKTKSLEHQSEQVASSAASESQSSISNDATKATGKGQVQHDKPNESASGATYKSNPVVDPRDQQLDKLRDAKGNQVKLPKNSATAFNNQVDQTQPTVKTETVIAEGTAPSERSNLQIQNAGPTSSIAQSISDSIGSLNLPAIQNIASLLTNQGLPTGSSQQPTFLVVMVDNAGLPSLPSQTPINSVRGPAISENAGSGVKQDTLTISNKHTSETHTHGQGYPTQSVSLTASQNRASSRSADTPINLGHQRNGIETGGRRATGANGRAHAVDPERGKIG